MIFEWIEVAIRGDEVELMIRSINTEVLKAVSALHGGRRGGVGRYPSCLPQRHPAHVILCLNNENSVLIIITSLIFC